MKIFCSTVLVICVVISSIYISLHLCMYNEASQNKCVLSGGSGGPALEKIFTATPDNGPKAGHGANEAGAKCKRIHNQVPQ